MISILKHVSQPISTNGHMSVYVQIDIISQSFDFIHFFIAPQFQPPFANYEIHHEQYSPQPSYYPCILFLSSVQAILLYLPFQVSDYAQLSSCRLGEAGTFNNVPNPLGERWQQPSFVQPAIGFTGN